MLRFEITYDGGKRFVLAGSPAEALEKFAAEWIAFGDPLPSAYWITESWGLS